MINSLGHVDDIVISGDFLIISGWAASPDHEPPKKFEVNCCDVVFPEIECTSEVDSSDVKKVYPHWVGTERCRFLLKISISADDADKIRKSPVQVIPFFGDMCGRTLLARIYNYDLPIPPEEYIKFIGGDLTSGLEFIDYFINECNLRSSDSILDVGCGYGRMAIPFTTYLSKDGRYEGFDISSDLIDWARTNITSRYPQITFSKVDIFNKLYNPDGKIRSADFEFPYHKDNFDLVFLTSVFTHMYPEDIKQYLSEIFRVLRKGGNCLLTCFLLTPESKELMGNGSSSLNFSFPLKDCFTVDLNTPENAIAYEEITFLKWITEHGFSVKLKHYGSWCGRTRFTSYQDILIIEKT
jgi:ubiquinone/menaquinone biosynthesis C-methylase UbiE